ncbi:MAG: hypothetical protein ACOYN0_18635, partial [Phycisphaerales bacterium]
GTGTANGALAGSPRGSYRLAANTATNTVELSQLAANLIGPATNPRFPITTSVTYQSFLTAAPNLSYPFIAPIPVPLGDAEVAAVNVAQTGPSTGTLTPAGPNQYTFTLSVPTTTTSDVIFQGAPIQNVQNATVNVQGTLNTSTGASTLTVAVSSVTSITTPVPLEPNVPFDLPPLSGTGEPAHLLMTLSINTQSTNLSGTAVLPATGVPACGADWNHDNGVDGDDVIAFFADWDISQADYTGDGGTDGDDVIAFFADWDAGC